MIMMSADLLRSKAGVPLSCGVTGWLYVNMIESEAFALRFHSCADEIVELVDS